MSTLAPHTTRLRRHGAETAVAACADRLLAGGLVVLAAAIAAATGALPVLATCNTVRRRTAARQAAKLNARGRAHWRGR